MWITLLARFWPYIAGLAFILGAAWYFHHAGYESGRADELALWKPRFDAAERERDAANERTRKTEAASTQVSEESQRRVYDAQQTLHVRTVDYDSRFRALSVRYAAARASCQSMPPIPGATAGAAAASESERRAAEVGSHFAGIGSDCEDDSARLGEWIRWYREQREIALKYGNEVRQ